MATQVRDKEAVLTAAEVAALMRVSTFLVYEAARKNEIPHVRLGRRLLFPRAALERFLSGTASSD